jgi:tRNA-splicing ligase RtcB
VVIPNAVGVDIGCGMGYVETNLTADMLRQTQTANGTLLQGIIGDILRNIPVGFSHHQKRQSSTVLDTAMQNLDLYEIAPALLPEIEEGYFQIGTLGGGNHFIEIQEDESGGVTIMLHSGSRHFGNKIGAYFHAVARELNKKWASQVPDEWRLAFLPVDSAEGELYLHYMNLALEFARENREKMLEVVCDTVNKWVVKHCGISAQYKNKVNAHHNYAAYEQHYGKGVWVHRKGAISAREGEIGIIPGAMGSFSYIVRGKGNPESFMSSSHGAGRTMSRKAAMARFNLEEVILDLKEKGVVLGKNGKKDIPEECRLAYKDIDLVIQNQADLIEPLKKLKTLGVVKG